MKRNLKPSLFNIKKMFKVHDMFIWVRSRRRKRNLARCYDNTALKRMQRTRSKFSEVLDSQLPNWIGKLKKMEEKLKNVIVGAASTSIGGFRVLNTWKVNEMNTTEEQILSFHGSPAPAAEGIVSDGLRSRMKMLMEIFSVCLQKLVDF
jgi:hypothetical protein